jgi:hypothetical protein
MLACTLILLNTPVVFYEEVDILYPKEKTIVYRDIFLEARAARQ